MDWDSFLLPYAEAVDSILERFRSFVSILKANGDPLIESVEGRVKTVPSILEKAERKDISLDRLAEEMADIAGIRVLCRFINDIPRIASLIENTEGLGLKVIDIRDYVTNSKASGYRSHHIIVLYPVSIRPGPAAVPCEIQIRTLAMNHWAGLEHPLRFKYKGKMPDKLKERLLAGATAARQFDEEIAGIREEILEAEREFIQKN